MATLSWLSATNTPTPSNARDFAIQGADTRRVTGALWLPAEPQANTPMVLLGHGASGNRYQAPLPHLAKRFTQEFGFAVLAIDGPVHGLRQVGDGGRGAFFQEMQRPSFLDDMVADWRLAYELVVASLPFAVGTLGYFGLSMGTIFGVPLLAAAIAAEDSAPSLNVVVATLGLCGSSGATNQIGQRLLADAARIKVPVLFLMQLEDELFDRAGCLQLFDALAATDKRLHANPGLHPEVPAEEIAHAVNFIANGLQDSVSALTAGVAKP